MSHAYHVNALYRTYEYTLSDAHELAMAVSPICTRALEGICVSLQKSPINIPSNARLQKSPIKETIFRKRDL